MKLDIVIATYNRHVRAGKTIQQFLEIERRFFRRIIVVDSSDELTYPEYSSLNEIIYIRSSHKNQPYQRFLGSLASKSDILLYIDDDIDLVNLESLLSGISKFSNDKVVGVSFSSTGGNEFVRSAPRSISAEWNGRIGRCIKYLSGCPIIKSNKYWLCGLRGKRIGEAPIEYFTGEGFAVRRAAIYKNFNFNLFDLYEKGLGKGEDVILGNTLSHQGVVWSNGVSTFYHDDQKNSSYSFNFYRFFRRVSYSRLYMSLEYARLNRINSIVARLHYHWYMFWRTVALAVSFCIRPSLKRLNSMYGWFIGWGRTMFKFFKSMEKSEKYWRKEAEKDLGNAKI